MKKYVTSPKCVPMTVISAVILTRTKHVYFYELTMGETLQKVALREDNCELKVFATFEVIA
jgi:hypothetical protein